MIQNILFDFDGTLSDSARGIVACVRYALECFGIVGMAAVNMKDGLVKLLKKDYLNHGISVLVDEENGISLDFHVIIAYGVSVQTVADNLMETVKYKVEELTGMTVKKMNIYVEGVRVID